MKHGNPIFSFCFFSLGSLLIGVRRCTLALTESIISRFVGVCSLICSFLYKFGVRTGIGWSAFAMSLSMSFPRPLIRGVRNRSYLPYGDFDLALGDICEISVGRIGVMFIEFIKLFPRISCSVVVFRLKTCVELDKVVSSSVILFSDLLLSEEISFCKVIEA